MEHPEAVITKAKQLEQLLLRMEAGEAFEQIVADLGLELKPKDVPKLQTRYRAGGREWERLIDGRYGHEQTVTAAMREWLYERKRQHPGLRAPQLMADLEQQFGVRVAAGHINYLLRKRGLTHTSGRPRKSPDEPQASLSPDEPINQPVENAGIFFPGGRQAGDADPGSG
jgi:transposase